MTGNTHEDVRAEIRDKVIALLEEQRQLIARAVDEAASATTHADAKQEGKYDTRAIESSYLAGAQAERLQDLTQKIQTITRMIFPPQTEALPVRVTSIVCAEDEDSNRSWYMLLPGAGGLKVDARGLTVTILAPESPLGQELLGKFVDEEITTGPGRVLTIGKIL